MIITIVNELKTGNFWRQRGFSAAQFNMMALYFLNADWIKTQ